MRFAITGGSGFVGRYLAQNWLEQGHEVIAIGRAAALPDGQTATKYIQWNPAQQILDRSALEGIDIMVHLAGENIADGRWTKQKKERIRSSRTQGTSFIAETIGQLTDKPQLFLSASAIGYYGNQSADRELDESSPKGSDFLSNVVNDWEDCTTAAEQNGIRTAHLRFGMILDQTGGALSTMLLPFRLGIGGRIGSGLQMMSWIQLREIPSIIDFLIQHPELHGSINTVSPEPVTNAEFTQALGQVLQRPTSLPLPANILRLLFGEMADSLLIGGSQVKPKKLIDAGYKFQYPDIRSALEESLRN